jgi:hypothetical protein
MMQRLADVTVAASICGLSPTATFSVDVFVIIPSMISPPEVSISSQGQSVTAVVHDPLL